ncbi:MAG TPA: fructose-6-phosphate aldolase [Deltaproteobacteria bacterium]|nr:fructose-6-phosphate aldolase [Deltaproteobacteria bacterium]
MKFFVDSAVVDDIKQAKALGLADGVTTNPTLIRKSGRDFREAITEISGLVQGPVLAEPVSETVEGILKEGRELAGWAPNVYVKIPLTRAGLEAVQIFRKEGIRSALTLIFNAAQALLAAKAGASIICPFVGRLDDIASPGMALIREIVDLYSNYPDIETEVIVASVRNANHVVEAAACGADGVTIPSKVIEQMMKHPLTDSGIRQFLADWNKVQ